jgi:hypothetical protein
MAPAPSWSSVAGERAIRHASGFGGGNLEAAPDRRTGVGSAERPLSVLLFAGLVRRSASQRCTCLDVPG